MELSMHLIVRHSLLCGSEMFYQVFFLFFEMFDSTIPRNSKGRLLAENNILRPNVINAIACEGSERVERPETHRQWQARNLRAGFVQLPVDSLIKKRIERTVGELYHKEFVVIENNKWFLLGWKGSIAYALSTWEPKECESIRYKKCWSQNNLASLLSFL
jgi:GRAS domain family